MARQIKDADVYAATLETLLAKGYAGATTKRIAEQAGINEVTLFRKYGSKAQLVAAALQHERTQLESQEIEYTGDLAADLLQVVRLYHSASPRHSQLILLIMAEMVRYPELSQTMQVPYLLVQKFSKIIAQYQAEGQLRAGDPILIVGALLGPVILNTILRSAVPQTGDAPHPHLPVPPLDLQAHVEYFLAGYGLQQGTH